MAGKVNPEFAAEALEEQFHPAPCWVENTCMWICELAIAAMGVIVLVEIFTRNLLGFSYEVSEELGGYIICAITFLSLSVSQVYRSYHHVQFVQTRLSPRWQAVSHLVFDLCNLLLCVLFVWQLARVTLLSYRAEDIAPTLLATPLWIPQAVMPVGAAAAVVSLARSAIGNLRRVRAAWN